MKKFRLLNEALIFCVILLMVGCTQKDVNINEVNDTNKIRVVTTMYASYDFVNQIVGDEVEVTMLLSPGEETHSYDPTPQDIIGIQNCDLFIYNGGENDSWVSGVLSTIEGEVPTIKMMECVDHLYEEVGHGCEDGHDHEVDAEYDEHVWGSPLNAIKIIQVISAKLQEVNPEYTKI